MRQKKFSANRDGARPISKNSKKPNPSQPSRYGEYVAQWLHDFVGAAKNAAFVDCDPTRGYFRQVNLENWSIESFHGDKRSVDYEKVVKGAIAGVMDQSEPGKKPRPVPRKQAELPGGKGFGAYFLPPIIIGKLPKSTIGDRLRGTMGRHMHMTDRKSFVQPFGETPVIVTNNGHVGACTGDSELAIRILNTIMATFEMKGLEARAVLEDELTEIEYDPEMLNIILRSYDPDKTRNKPVDGYPNELTPKRAVREMKEETVKSMIEAASKIFEDPSMTKMVVDFGDMLANMKDGEFRQAFTIGWIIVEEHIFQKWKDESGSESASVQKDSKRRPRADTMLRAIRSTIPSQNYDAFMDLKCIRNEYMHEGGRITKQQAQNMLDAVKNYVLEMSH